MDWSSTDEGSVSHTMTANRKMRDALVERLKAFDFNYALTIGWNHKSCTTNEMRRKLKDYDARMNRWLNGTRWLDKSDERMNWLAFPEKVETNPHWHLLVSLDHLGFKDHRQARYSAFENASQRTWLKLVPHGTAHCTPLAQGAFEWYVTKELNLSNRYELFILSREFDTR